MRFEAKGISWKETSDDKESRSLPSCHCGFEGCSVRHNLNGYFTVIHTPEQPFFIEKSGLQQ